MKLYFQTYKPRFLPETDDRIWREIRGDEEIVKWDQSFRTTSSIAEPSPFVRLGSFSADNHTWMRSLGDEVAVEDHQKRMTGVMFPFDLL